MFNDDAKSAVVDTADTDLVVVSDSLSVNSANSDSVNSADFRVVDSLSVIRKEGTRKSYLIVPLVVQRKWWISALEEKGDVRACICDLSYNYFEGETFV